MPTENQAWYETTDVWSNKCLQGQLIDGGSTHFGVNIAGFILHSAIHSARPDAKCVVHVHHPAVVAVRTPKTKTLNTWN